MGKGGWSRSASVSSLSSSLDTSAGVEAEDLDLMDCLVADVGLVSQALNSLSSVISGQPPSMTSISSSTSGTGSGQTEFVWICTRHKMLEP